jgi:hypothetical protein
MPLRLSNNIFARAPLAREQAGAPRSPAEMMVNRNIWTVAAWLIAKHGDAAPKVVSARIATLRQGDVETSAISSWLQVDHAVHELTRGPGDGERLN